uniref:uncharacterized protein LOC114680579 n=1 Tax=Macaca mulatta TaxID=9544 RepID=UPI0010A1FCB4|nr:uncharacterized protein LOC114680579 [Macaca mulatta]
MSLRFHSREPRGGRSEREQERSPLRTSGALFATCHTRSPHPTLNNNCGEERPLAAGARKLSVPLGQRHPGARRREREGEGHSSPARPRQPAAPEREERGRVRGASGGARGGTSALPGRHRRTLLARPGQLGQLLPPPTWSPGRLRARLRGAIAPRPNPGGVSLGTKGLTIARSLPEAGSGSGWVWRKQTRASWVTDSAKPPRTPAPRGRVAEGGAPQRGPRHCRRGFVKCQRGRKREFKGTGGPLNFLPGLSGDLAPRFVFVFSARGSVSALTLAGPVVSYIILHTVNHF